MAFATFALTPEFEYVVSDQYRTTTVGFEGGTIQTRAVWPRPRRIFILNWRAAIQSDKEYIESFLRDKVGAAGSFSYVPADPVASPLNPGEATSVAQVTGSYTSRTYFYQITWETAGGETLVSPEQSLALSADTLFVLTVPKFPTNVTGAKIYVDTSTTAETLQTTLTTSGDTWTEPDTAGPTNGLVAGASPPTTNTATETVTVHVLEDLFTSQKNNNVSYSMQLQLQEIF